MSLISRPFAPTLLAVVLLLASASAGAAQGVIVTRYSPPTVTCYYPAPTVTYYAAPTVTYYSPRVIYPAPAVSYYAPPSASNYYAGPVTTMRYGPLGRPRLTTYYYPTYVFP